ncbi:hypothetical protein ABK040_011617 [Willaertia magna]
MLRIDRILSGMGICSRSEAVQYLRKNIITDPKNNKRILSTSHKVCEKDINKLLCNGKVFDYPTLNLTILLNKPVGYLCSTSREESNHKIIYDLLPIEFFNRSPLLSSVGRLDLESCGLLILTQDGQLQHQLLSSPTLEKRYLVGFTPPLVDEKEIIEMKRVFESGKFLLRSEEEPLKPVTNFEVIDDTHIAISIVEGRYHQVRRMFAAFGKRVEFLKRIQIGSIEIDEVIEKEGKWRVMKEEEIVKLSSV